MALVPRPHDTLAVFRGDSFNLRIPVVQTDGSAKNLTAALSVRYGWSRTHVGGPKVFEYDAAGSPAVVAVELPTAAGFVLISVPIATMVSLAPDDYVDELEVIDAGGNKKTPWWGPITLLGDLLT